MDRAPEGYVFGEGGLIVLIPARVCAILARHGVISRARVDFAHRDPELAAVLVAIEVAARAWLSTGGGTPLMVQPEPAAPLEQHLSTGQAADLLNVTDRGIRKAIERGDLKAEQVAGRWVIARTDLNLWKKNRCPR